MKLTKNQLLKIVRENLNEFRSLDDRDIAVGAGSRGGMSINPIRAGVSNLKTNNPRQFKKLSNAARKFMPSAAAGATVLSVGVVADAMELYFKENEPEIQFTVKDKPIDFDDPKWLNKLNLAAKPKTKQRPRESKSLEFFVYTEAHRIGGVLKPDTDYVLVGGKSAAEAFRNSWCIGRSTLKKLYDSGKFKTVKEMMPRPGTTAHDRYAAAVKSSSPYKTVFQTWSGRFGLGKGYGKLNIDQLAYLLQTVFCGDEYDYDAITIHDYRTDYSACETRSRQTTEYSEYPVGDETQLFKSKKLTLSSVLFMSKMPIRTESYPCKNFFFLQNLK